MDGWTPKYQGQQYRYTSPPTTQKAAHNICFMVASVLLLYVQCKSFPDLCTSRSCFPLIRQTSRQIFYKFSKSSFQRILLGSNIFYSIIPGNIRNHKYRINALTSSIMILIVKKYNGKCMNNMKYGGFWNTFSHVKPGGVCSFITQDIWSLPHQGVQ